MPQDSDPGARPRIPAFARALLQPLVVLLVVSAALTLAWLPSLRAGVAEGRWPRGMLAIPPALLALFICGYAAYRYALVRAGRYSAGKALAQLGLMILALGIVTGLAMETVPSRRPTGRIERGLRAGDPEVRAMAAELARHRPPEVARRLAPLLVGLLRDGDPVVRREAHQSLVAIAGEDLGEGDASLERWRARFETHTP